MRPELACPAGTVVVHFPPWARGVQLGILPRCAMIQRGLEPWWGGGVEVVGGILIEPKMD